MRRIALIITFAALLAACVGVPEGVSAVRGFNADRYLGKWFSIARLDHRFERDLEQVTAEYSKREDGGLRVVNRGYNPQTKEWKSVEGRAYFVDAPDVAALKVTFFWPFYGGYNVIELAPDYSWAMVAGPNRDYLWILSRTPRLDQPTTDRLVGRARALGFPVERLTFVPQAP